MLDLDATLRQLYDEKTRLDSVIDSLTALDATPRVKSKRGRKFMPEEERQAASRRMRDYWAKRRQQKECGVPSVREARSTAIGVVLERKLPI